MLFSRKKGNDTLENAYCGRIKIFHIRRCRNVVILAAVPVGEVLASCKAIQERNQWENKVCEMTEQSAKAQRSDNVSKMKSSIILSCC